MNIKITQIKSGIDRSERQKRTLVALGLKKLNAHREVEATPQILGMVKKVSHLLKVDVIDDEIIEPIVVAEEVTISEKKKKTPKVETSVETNTIEEPTQEL